MWHFCQFLFKNDNFLLRNGLGIDFMGQKRLDFGAKMKFNFQFDNFETENRIFLWGLFYDFLIKMLILIKMTILRTKIGHFEEKFEEKDF